MVDRRTTRFMVCWKNKNETKTHHHHENHYTGKPGGASPQIGRQSPGPAHGQRSGVQVARNGTEYWRSTAPARRYSRSAGSAGAMWMSVATRLTWSFGSTRACASAWRTGVAIPCIPPGEQCSRRHEEGQPLALRSTVLPSHRPRRQGRQGQATDTPECVKEVRSGKTRRHFTGRDFF